MLYAQFLGVSQVYLCALLDVIERSDTFLVPLVCSGRATAVDSGEELCVCVCMCVFVGSCLVTKVFRGNLPATGRGWIIIK